MKNQQPVVMRKLQLGLQKKMPPSTSKFQNEEEATDGYTKMSFNGIKENTISFPKSSSQMQTKESKPIAPNTPVNAEEDSSAYANVSANRPASNSSDTSISTSDLEEVYNSMRKKENSQFFDQFQKILLESTKLGGPKKFASNPDLKKKNRYRNILPWSQQAT
uniref:uncharacterized protein LOC120334899 n=1 Tax=Styela clava TaxID=7725 RepID=UPI00193A4196|nr:uncharacterized protein LOC120334899 [Styela clava]